MPLIVIVQALIRRNEHPPVEEFTFFTNDVTAADAKVSFICHFPHPVQGLTIHRFTKKFRLHRETGTEHFR
jgi:hypothetical protein